jgi:SAM-dependent methyltransferase
MENEQERWNRIFETSEAKPPIYDDWLDKYSEVLKTSRDTPIIDLGCGFGNNSLYLYERGYQVISCDFAESALQRLSHFIINPVTRLFDLRSRFPFEDGTAKIVIADLCLHYFSEAETIGIIAEIGRILSAGGWLYARVNSVNDVNYGAGEGILIEPYCYEQNGNRKRFFDESSIRVFFAEWKIKALHEYEMSRYLKPKMAWEIAAQTQSIVARINLDPHHMRAPS